jgi:DNA-binding transcriptional LysR family regulator
MEMMAVASPQYLAKHGTPKSPGDLHRHACINWRFPGSGHLYRWKLAKGRKKLELSVQGPLIANWQDVAVEGALQGLGILYAYDDQGVVEALRDGRLKRVLVDWSPIAPGLFLYYPGRRHLQPPLRAFIDCLLDQKESKRTRPATA